MDIFNEKINISVLSRHISYVIMLEGGDKCGEESAGSCGISFVFNYFPICMLIMNELLIAEI
jgi:hypothetical protein